MEFVLFDRSVSSSGRGVDCFIVSPSGIEHEISILLEFGCMSNQVEYEGWLASLEMMEALRIQRVQIFGHSKLVIQ
jgi:ribonuclease HI